MENTNDSDSRAHAAGKFCLRRTVKSLVWLAVTTGIYIATLKLSLQHPEWGPGTRVAVTLIPLLPGVFYLLSLLQTFRTMDELQRRIQSEAWVFALAGTVVVTTVLNVLNANGIGPAGYHNGLLIGGVYMSMFLFWSVGVTVSTLRYR